MTKHTPGPWAMHPGNLSSVSIRARNGFAVCACRFKAPDGRTTRESIEWGKANARLIAAAPDMADLARNVAGLDDRAFRNMDIHTLRATILEYRDQARAAIAKATGEA